MGNLRQSMTEEEWNSFHTNPVDHPKYYGGKENPYEAIKVIEAWELDFNLGNVLKYISRAGKKGEWKHMEDLQKAAWYLDRAIKRRIEDA